MGHLWRRFLLLLLILIVAGRVTGCVESPNSTDTWYAKAGWTAESYFDDQKVVQLCKAIESRDIHECENLIASGANVNAKGKDGMTPLMWAYPAQNSETFTLLLRHGADSNVTISSDLNTQGTLVIGDSVAILAARKGQCDYLKAVLDHGIDPNLKNKRGDTLLHLVIKGSRPVRWQCIQYLLDHGADINALSTAYDNTPVMAAVSYAEDYNVALLLLRAGADYKKYGKTHNQRLIHFVVAQSGTVSEGKQKDDYDKLLTFLVKHGESVEAAQTDIDKWAAQPTWNPAAMKVLREQEVAERKRRESHTNK
jgi:ankyrin repeat protein